MTYGGTCRIRTSEFSELSEEADGRELERVPGFCFMEKATKKSHLRASSGVETEESGAQVTSLGR